MNAARVGRFNNLVEHFMQNRSCEVIPQKTRKFSLNPYTNMMGLIWFPRLPVFYDSSSDEARDANR